MKKTIHIQRSIDSITSPLRFDDIVEAAVFCKNAGCGKLLPDSTSKTPYAFCSDRCKFEYIDSMTFIPPMDTKQKSPYLVIRRPHEDDYDEWMRGTTKELMEGRDV